MFDWLKHLFGKSSGESAEQKAFDWQTIESHEISPIEVKQKIDAGEDITLVDVRTSDERDKASLPNVLHIPRDDVHARYTEIGDDPSKAIVVFCHHGIESEQVMHQLWGLGYQNAKVMSGGIDAWSVEADPTVPRY